MNDVGTVGAVVTATTLIDGVETPEEQAVDSAHAGSLDRSY